MKILSGSELAGFIKERQAHEVRRMITETGRMPKLLIIRDSDDPVIKKYVGLKKRYGEDIGVEVEEFYARTTEEVRERILAANEDAGISGMIVQLPLREVERTDEVVTLITSEKDVDGLSGEKAKFDSATATAINWLLSGYDIPVDRSRVAIVGRGRLVGGPLERIFKRSGVEVTVFEEGDDLTKLKEYDIIITATGVPHLILSRYVKSGATVVDAGTASENGVLVGDVDDEVRERGDLGAITPKIGGVGPLTVCVLFENVINAAKEQA